MDSHGSETGAVFIPAYTVATMKYESWAFSHFYESEKAGDPPQEGSSAVVALYSIYPFFAS